MFVCVVLLSLSQITFSNLNCRSGKENEKKPDENCLILKYIKNHVRDLFHVPIAVLVKSAAILTEDLFVEAIPVAWELLLEKNQVCC